MLLCHSDVINAIKKQYLKSSPKDEETKLHRLIAGTIYLYKFSSNVIVQS